MPRIIAPTLAEHRDLRRSALLQAGRDLLFTGGPRAVTMAAVAQQAGLSRPAVYEYFPSSDALIGELLLDEMRRWSGDISDAVAAAATPTDKVRTFVRTSLALVADGRHRLASAVGDMQLPEPVLAQARELHYSMAGHLIQALEALGVDDAVRCSQLLQGVVQAAGRRVESGTADVAAETQAAERFILAGIEAVSTERA